MRITNYELRITNYKIFVFAFLFLPFVFGLNAKAQTETPPAPAQPRPVSIPKPVEKTLPNGLRVIVVERKNVPLVTAMLMVKSGGEVDPNNLAGAADMTAELLTKGTKTRTASQIAEQIEFLGGSIESGASWDFSSVTFRVMSDKLDKAMEIAADTVQNPTFAQEEIDRYKAQVLDELSVNLTQPGTLASYVTNRVVFGEDKYARYGHPLGGTPESIKRITRANLVNLHLKHYKADNAALVIAGDVAPQTAFTLARNHFGKWGKPVKIEEWIDPTEITSSQEGVKIPETLEIKQITVVDLPGSGQAAVSVAQRTFSRNNRVYFTALTSNSVLGGGYSARLNQEIRIKRGLSYGARSDFLPRNESAAEVAEIILTEMTKLGREEVSENELTSRRAVLIGDFSRDLETTGGLVNQIGQLALYDIKLDEISSFIQNVQDVETNNVKSYMSNVVRSTPTNIVIVGDAKKFLPDLQKRFVGVKVDVIKSSELDLNTATLRKATATSGKQVVKKR
jgi:zinc protease